MAFQLVKFRALYPQFDAVDDVVVEAVAEQAACYMPTGCACGDLMLMLMVAHLLQLRNNQLAGGMAGPVASATISGVSVTLAQPANADERSLWLGMTPFGMEYAVLEAKCIKGKAAAGLMFGGLPEGKAFRRVGGILK